MEIHSLQRQVRAADLPIEKLAASTQISEQEKLAEVSRQFESILLRQILADAHKPLFDSTLNPKSAASEVYRDMITSRLADQISRGDGIGLANLLARQLELQDPPSQI